MRIPVQVDLDHLEMCFIVGNRVQWNWECRTHSLRRVRVILINRILDNRIEREDVILDIRLRREVNHNLGVFLDKDLWFY